MKSCQIWKETLLRPKRKMMPQHRICQRGLKGLKTTLFLVSFVGFLLVYLSCLYLLTILMCLYNAAEHSQHIDTQTKLVRRVRKIIFSCNIFLFFVIRSVRLSLFDSWSWLIFFHSLLICDLTHQVKEYSQLSDLGESAHGVMSFLFNSNKFNNGKILEKKNINNTITVKFGEKNVGSFLALVEIMKNSHWCRRIQ